MTTSIEPLDLVQVWEVSDLEVPCDWGDESMLLGKHDDPARWVLWTKDHGCGVKIRLACDRCKNLRMDASSKFGVICRWCGLFTTPACKAYSRIEALK